MNASDPLFDRLKARARALGRVAGRGVDAGMQTALDDLRHLDATCRRDAVALRAVQQLVGIYEALRERELALRPPRRAGGVPFERRFSDEQLMELMPRCTRQAEVARALGVSPSTVSRRITKLLAMRALLISGDAPVARPRALIDPDSAPAPLQEP